MGTKLRDCKPRLAAVRPVVAFDFDGTLTTTDSFGQFLRWRSDPRGLILALAKLTPAAARYFVRRDRGALKSAAMRAFFGGVEEAQLEREADAFAQEVFDRLIRTDALEQWDAHGREGAERVIVTASPEFLVEPFAARLGADRLLGTRLQIDDAGRINGDLAGANCRGAEKVKRLRAAYGAALRLAAAYGDTGGDREMLAIADQPRYRVFRSSGKG